MSRRAVAYPRARAPRDSERRRRTVERTDPTASSAGQWRAPCTRTGLPPAAERGRQTAPASRSRLRSQAVSRTKGLSTAGSYSLIPRPLLEIGELGQRRRRQRHLRGNAGLAMPVADEQELGPPIVGVAALRG